MEIIDAQHVHLSGITAIYNDAAEQTTAIWNEVTVDEENRKAWLAEHQQDNLPVLVAIAGNDEVLGYATYGPWRAWDGYRHTVEHSVYVRADQRGKGLGKALMLELITRARACGMHVMVAGIEAENIGSIKLHEKLGFDNVGTLKQVGEKFGSWLDLTFLQLQLDDKSTPA